MSREELVGDDRERELISASVHFLFAPLLGRSVRTCASGS
jgi:hypothetical protein